MMCSMESGEARKSEYGVWQGLVPVLPDAMKIVLLLDGW